MTITINGTDQTGKVILRTFRIEQVLTQEADTARFSLLSPDTIPVLLQEVIILDALSARIFAGVVINIVTKYDGLQAVYEITCKDYSELMDGKYVVENYTSQTVSYILNDILTKYLPAGFTVNCAVTQTISYIKFNYEKPSQCFKKLAELVLGDWYVDYNKVVRFVSKSTTSAPFGVTDANNKVTKSSLQIRQDASQIKNTVYVRGGEYLGSSYTETFSADGQQTTFPLAYQYSGLTVTVAGVSKTVGIDNITDPATVDCLYNFTEKAVKFPSASKPTVGQAVAVSGLPYIPVYVKAEESASVNKYGVKEFKIVDSNIKSKQGAIDRAKAEIQSYNESLNDGSFSSYETGLRAGQQINIASTILGITDDFVINRLTIVAESASLLRYDAQLTTMENFTLVQLLQQLLDLTQLGEDKTDEVLEKLYNIYETATIEEAINIIATLFAPETATIGENVRNDPFGAGVLPSFVLTPYSVVDENDTKRPFIVENSFLS
jgi:hypothetical protein